MPTKSEFEGPVDLETIAADLKHHSTRSLRPSFPVGTPCAGIDRGFCGRNVDLGRLIGQSLAAVRHTVSSAEQLLDTLRQFAMLIAKIATSDDPGLVTADSGLARARRGGRRLDLFATSV